ncbi:MAG TPA: hypothetical protein VF066_09690 [Thermoleophilaceae bacterium]
MDVPVQYFQSVIAIELAVAGALLWQIRYFEPEDTTRRGPARQLPAARVRLGLAGVLGMTVFGSLWAMADDGPKWAAVAITVGLAISLIPILVRVMRPLAQDVDGRPTHTRSESAPRAERLGESAGTAHAGAVTKPQ